MTKRKVPVDADGNPRWVRCYDNGGESFDRYTVVFTKKAITNTRHDRWFMYLGMSTHPFHPQGFVHHGESPDQPIDKPAHGHLGKKIRFKDLPPDCQKCTWQTYRLLWGPGQKEGEE